MKDRIVLLGPPATGKGTQAGLLSSTFGIPAASTGAILRQQIKDNPSIASADWIREGNLAPDDVVIHLVWSWLGNRRRFILDGFPRTISQATSFVEGLSARELPLSAVYVLELPREVIYERLLGRLTCLECGTVYNESFHKLANGQACPGCSGELARREDDTIAALDQRLEDYDHYTRPVVDFFQAQHILHRIDANRPRDDVFKQLYEDIRVK